MLEAGQPRIFILHCGLGGLLKWLWSLRLLYWNSRHDWGCLGFRHRSLRLLGLSRHRSRRLWRRSDWRQRWLRCSWFLLLCSLCKWSERRQRWLCCWWSLWLCSLRWNRGCWFKRFRFWCCRLHWGCHLSHRCSWCYFSRFGWSCKRTWRGGCSAVSFWWGCGPPTIRRLGFLWLLSGIIRQVHRLHPCCHLLRHETIGILGLHLYDSVQQTLYIPQQAMLLEVLSC
mmetsp:Transcript_26988/g.62296  ORF Transcript_26988/g.62296 Transcript_26988/m.62296 type:complete len:227 (+) Transcript_26988:229-909(+)